MNDHYRFVSMMFLFALHLFYPMRTVSGQKHADASVGAVETIKFVCREFWMNLFGRQATNLHMSTSHDYFVIVDDRFPWLLKCRHRDASRAREVALRFVAYSRLFDVFLIY